MLRVPQLDDITFSQLFTRARSKIPTLLPEWTDLNYHDPGITTLHTFAWLTDTLNYYLNSTGEQHRLKYLKLLGITPTEKAAETVVHVSGNSAVLPIGTRLLAENIMYETAEECHPTPDIYRVYNKIDDEVTDISASVATTDDYEPILCEDGKLDTSLYIGFAEKPQSTVKMYVQVTSIAGRNKFDGSFTLASLEWEYYSDGEWKPVLSVSDESHGFLQDGFITVEIGDITLLSGEGMDSGYYVRCRPTHNEYDTAPLLYSITTGCVTAAQTDTMSEYATYSFSGEPITLSTYVDDMDIISVWVKENDEYKLWFMPGGPTRANIERGEQSWQRVINFNDSDMPINGAEILVTVVPFVNLTLIDIGVTDGTANQRVPLYIDDVHQMTLGLKSVKDGETCMDIYTATDDLWACSHDDKKFYFDKNRQEIVFGDAMHGECPEQGMTICAVMLKKSLLDGGNILKGKLNEVANRFEEEITVINLKAAVGGERPKNATELEEEIAAKINKVSRAVSEADYKEIVMNTPGLMIDCVSVIPMKDYAAAYNVPFEQNMVVVAVKPHAKELYPTLSDAYKQVISANLEHYRLLTTNVQIVPAKYLNISVFGKVVFKENTTENQMLVLDTLRDFIDSHGEFGKGVVYGRLYSQLELLSCVERVEQLSLEYGGLGGYKNQLGDVVVHPDTLAVAHKFDFEFA